MIEDQYRFFSPNGSVWPRGPSTWNILDWDQLRIIAVTIDGGQDDEKLAIEHLRKNIDDLGPDMYEVHIAPGGNLLSQLIDQMMMLRTVLGIHRSKLWDRECS
jgi:hypothetical protein